MLARRCLREQGIYERLTLLVSQLLVSLQASFQQETRTREVTLAQGNLAERIRAAGAGIGAFYTPTGYGTLLAEGKEERVIDGRPYVLEYPIRADFALVAAHVADGLGNLVYRKTARNFGPMMAAAAATTVVQVSDIVPVGGLDPESVITPCIYVDRVLHVQRHPAPAPEPGQ